MIGLGSRFAEYGLTGGFFVFGQLFVLAWFFPEIAADWFSSIAKLLSARLYELPAAARPAFSNLLAALALVSIFFAGLLLDLIGSVLAAWEVKIFKRTLDVNAGWFSKFIETTGDQSRVDYEHIRKSLRRRSFAISRLWKREYAIGALDSFRRLETLLMAYVLASLGASSLDWLADQMRLCRTSRAISASLFVLALEVYGSIFAVSSISGSPPVGVIGVITAFLFLSGFITYRAYSRFCMTLFSLTYAYHRSSA